MSSASTMATTGPTISQARSQSRPSSRRAEFGREPTWVAVPTVSCRATGMPPVPAAAVLGDLPHLGELAGLPEVALGVIAIDRHEAALDRLPHRLQVRRIEERLERRRRLVGQFRLLEVAECQRGTLGERTRGPLRR